MNAPWRRTLWGASGSVAAGRAEPRTRAGGASRLATGHGELAPAQLLVWILPAALGSSAILAVGWILAARVYPLQWFVPVEAAVTIGVSVVFASIAALEILAHHSPASRPLLALGVAAGVLTAGRIVTFPDVVPGTQLLNDAYSAWLYWIVACLIGLGLIWQMVAPGQGASVRVAATVIKAGAVSGAILGVIAVVAPRLPAVIDAGGQVTNARRTAGIGLACVAVVLFAAAVDGWRRGRELAPPAAAASIALLGSALSVLLPVTALVRYGGAWYATHVLFLAAISLILAGQLRGYWLLLRAAQDALADGARRVRHLTMLHEAAATLTATLDLPTLRQEVVRAAAHIVSPEERGDRRVALFRIRDGVATMVAEYDETGRTATGTTFPVSSHPYIGRAIDSRHVTTGPVAPAMMGPGARALAQRTHIEAGAWAPILVDGEPSGVLAVVSRRRCTFSGDELDDLASISRLAGLAFSNAWRLEDERVMVSRLDALVGANVAVARRGHDVGAVIEQAALAARSLTEAGIASVHLLSEDGLRVETSATVPAAPHDALEVAIPAARLAAPLPSRATPFRLADVVTGDAERAAAMAAGLRTLLGVPLVIDGRVAGTIYAANKRSAEDGTDFNDEDAAVLTGLAAQTAVAIAGARSVRAIAERALIDPLTGTHNRLAFENGLHDRHSGGVAVLAIDVDHLKVVNDEAGHEAGDSVLRAVASAISSSVREADLVQRIGGDEFAVIMPQADSRAAVAAAERLRALLDATPVPHGQARVSVGVATGSNDEDVESVWCRADAALFTSKREGRNRTTVWQRSHDATAALRWDQVLRDVLDGAAMTAVFQPIRELSGNRDVIAFEALARPVETGLDVSVEGLFAIAQLRGRMRDLDWRCRRVCLDTARALPSGLPVFVNVSAGALIDPVHGVDQMLLLLAHVGRAPSDVVLEITERELVHDLDRLRVVTDAYRQAGIRFAVDDFGAGRGTIEMLTAIRPDFIKLSQGIVTTADRREITAIVSAIVVFAERTGARVLAEGIETEAALARMSALGVTLGQGYLLGWPMPDAQARKLARTTLARRTTHVRTDADVA
jgi:diguanylate cyclase (GGDEF)-like protein